MFHEFAVQLWDGETLFMHLETQHQTEQDGKNRQASSNVSIWLLDEYKSELASFDKMALLICPNRWRH